MRHPAFLTAMMMAALAPPLAARTAPDPRAFLYRLYAPYVAGDASFSPVGKAAPTIFDTALTALIRKDQQGAQGEVGALDNDPVCDCQDFDRLKSLSIRIRSRTAREAVAHISFINGSIPVGLTYRLVLTNRGAWRVSDIASKETPSLAGFLRQNGNR